MLEVASEGRTTKRTARRWGYAVAALAIAALAPALVLAGRWEHDRAIEAEIDGMRRIQAAVGPLDSPELSTFRDSPFTCLLYEVGQHPFALELCFGADGRLIEALDRRSGTLEVATLRFEPEASVLREDLGTINRLVGELKRRRELYGAG